MEAECNAREARGLTTHRKSLVKCGNGVAMNCREKARRSYEVRGNGTVSQSLEEKHRKGIVRHRNGIGLFAWEMR